MKKFNRKFKRFIGRLKKLKIGTRAMNLAMFLIGWFLVIGLSISMVQGFGIKTVVSNDSMIPTFEEEEVLKINKVVYKITSPNRMDTVAVKLGETKSNVHYVLRIVGLPGEKIQIKNGRIYIDDEVVEYAISGDLINDPGIAHETIVLEEDEYFMMCDNYNNSRNDSRFSNIGIINKSQIEDRVK